jgi:hypothetical protein
LKLIEAMEKERQQKRWINWQEFLSVAQEIGIKETSSIKSAVIAFF